ncbi:MAG: uracil-DNA glycosylase [Fimbriimonadaceae bacterium]|nr:uracil-DNA glycosylase [Fimbriimonadaceae bacterium]
MLEEWNREIVECQDCPRLRRWCLQVAQTKRKAFADQPYWGLPVPHFGDPEATCLIVGLAPAAHGANRTGRLFTGDRSGDFLFRALWRSKIANQPKADSLQDGLRLEGVLVTPIVHCAPPGNKPTPHEVENCRRHLAPLLDSREWRAILCLGAMAWAETLRHYRVKPRPKFGHGALHTESQTQIMGCFHPSQQNTFTGRLTEPMLQALTDWLAERRG